MPLFIEHPENHKINLGDVASIAWQRVSHGFVRWTFATSVPIRLETVLYQPPPAGQLISLDVPEGYKVRVGASTVWMTYEPHKSAFKVTIEGPPSMKAYRTQEKLEPQLYVPTNGGGPRQNAKRNYVPVAGGAA